MISFLFPEDLDPHPIERVECAAPRSKKLQDAFPIPSTRPRKQTLIPIIQPVNVNGDDSKDGGVTISVARLSLDERPSRLQKLRERKPLMRWKSVTLNNNTNTNKNHQRDDRQTRMALAEAERAAHEHARLDVAGKHSQYTRSLSPVPDEKDYQDIGYTHRADELTHIMF